MKHVYKVGGERKASCGTSYTIEAVSNERFESFISEGWFASLEEAKSAGSSTAPEQGSDYEAELRAEIKALGGKAAGRSSIETLEKQLKELKDGSDS